MSAVDVTSLTDRYVALWNEPDPETRHRLVRELWTDDAEHLLTPPAEWRAEAARIGFRTDVLVARGHDELTFRVDQAYEEFVAPGTFVFRSRGDAAGLRDMVTFTWEMVSHADGSSVGVGREVFLLDTDGRIRTDYQLIEG